MALVVVIATGREYVEPTLHVDRGGVIHIDVPETGDPIQEAVLAGIALGEHLQAQAGLH